jgi:hypothetical protein
MKSAIEILETERQARYRTMQAAGDNVEAAEERLIVAKNAYRILREDHDAIAGEIAKLRPQPLNPTDDEPQQANDPFGTAYQNGPGNPFGDELQTDLAANPFDDPAQLSDGGAADDDDAGIADELEGI